MTCFMDEYMFECFIKYDYIAGKPILKRVGFFVCKEKFCDYNNNRFRW
jgi:hypothetical protein